MNNLENVEEMNDDVEHFVTLFDSGFLLQGIALHASLLEHCSHFVLWVVCMDEQVELDLQKISLPCLRTISLNSIEHDYPELLIAKKDRTRAEYCWTTTPFCPQAVFKYAPSVKRVTYLDADIYFFGPPSNLLNELEEASAHVLITDHAFAPEYNQESNCGRFCVQFVTFLDTPGGREILTWWQKRCIEWCYNRHEDGKFGDQKYLDSWPTMWAESVHILKRFELTLAPWNAQHLLKDEQTPKGIFHFHKLRIYQDGKIFLWRGYQIPRGIANMIYMPYTRKLLECLEILHSHGIFPNFPIAQSSLFEMIKQKYRSFRHLESWANLRHIKRAFCMTSRTNYSSRTQMNSNQVDIGKSE